MVAIEGVVLRFIWAFGKEDFLSNAHSGFFIYIKLLLSIMNCNNLFLCINLPLSFFFLCFQFPSVFLQFLMEIFETQHYNNPTKSGKYTAEVGVLFSRHRLLFHGQNMNFCVDEIFLHKPVQICFGGNDVGGMFTCGVSQPALLTETYCCLIR